MARKTAAKSKMARVMNDMENHRLGNVAGKGASSAKRAAAVGLSVPELNKKK